MKIPYVNIANQNNKISKQLTSIFKNILDTGEYVGGKEIQKFERNIAKYCNSKYAVALNSGTDALTFACQYGVRRGDEVITTLIHLLHQRQ